MRGLGARDCMILIAACIGPVMTAHIEYIQRSVQILPHASKFQSRSE